MGISIENDIYYPKFIPIIETSIIDFSIEIGMTSATSRRCTNQIESFTPSKRHPFETKSIINRIRCMLMHLYTPLCQMSSARSHPLRPKCKFRRVTLFIETVMVQICSAYYLNNTYLRVNYCVARYNRKFRSYISRLLCVAPYEIFPC